MVHVTQSLCSMSWRPNPPLMPCAAMRRPSRPSQHSAPPLASPGRTSTRRSPAPEHQLVTPTHRALSHRHTPDAGQKDCSCQVHLPWGATATLLSMQYHIAAWNSIRQKIAGVSPLMHRGQGTTRLYDRHVLSLLVCSRAHRAGLCSHDSFRDKRRDDMTSWWCNRQPRAPLELFLQLFKRLPQAARHMHDVVMCAIE